MGRLEAICEEKAAHLSRYHQSMVQLHKIVWGWSQSFRHTTAKQIFERLDKDIDKRIVALNAEANRLIPAGDAATGRRVMGLHLLADAAGIGIVLTERLFTAHHEAPAREVGARFVRT